MPTKSSIKVGDVIFYRYTGYWGSPYRQVEVVGETSRSWLILAIEDISWQRSNPERYADKLPKNFKGFELGNDVLVARHRWAVDNRYLLSKAVSSLTSIETIIAIGKLLDHPGVENV